MRKLLAHRLLTLFVCLVALCATAMPSAHADALDEGPNVYVFKVKDGAGNLVYKSPIVDEATAQSGFEPPNGVTPQAAGSIQGNACWIFSVTALSGWFHTKLYTMNLAKCWKWGYGTVLAPNHFAWVEFHALNWCCPSTSSNVSYFYAWSWVPNSGHASKVQMQTQCTALFVPCGYGHPWVHAYAHGDGTFTWSGGIG